MAMVERLRDAYLRRLGVEADAPSVEALFALHRAHVEQVAYETLWIHLGDRWPVDLAVSSNRIATQRRGGYCFHLNGAFSELLSSLGYDVVCHVGGVHGPLGPTEDEMTNHLVLTVQGLPTAENPEGTWYVDAGLGDALHEPLPLVPGTYEQPPFTLVIAETPGGVGDWHLTHDPKGGFAGMAWRSEPTDIDAFADRHELLSTSPESGFVKVLTAQRREAAGVDILRGLSLRRIGADAYETEVESCDELVDVLTGLFRLDLDGTAPEELDDLWSRTHDAHVRWVEAGRP